MRQSHQLTCVCCPAAAATAGASRGLDGKNREDFQQGHDVHEADNRELLNSQGLQHQHQQQQQQAVLMKTMTGGSQAQNGANGYSQNQDLNGANRHAQSQRTGNGAHWQNMVRPIVLLLYNSSLMPDRLTMGKRISPGSCLHRMAM